MALCFFTQSNVKKLRPDAPEEKNGLTDNQVRTATLLHELLHSMYILGPDEDDQQKIDQTNRDIVNKCIK